jgi:hypothetical protein
MTRKLKVLGIALVAVFAIGAVVASAASAQNGIVTSDGPFTLKGVPRVGAEEKANSLTAFGQVTNCPKATYTGHRVEVTPHENVPNNSSSVTITPSFGTCSLGGTIKGTIDMNGCDFVGNLTKTTAVADQYGVTSTIVCPAGKHIVETLFTNATFHAENKSFCHITFTDKPSYDGLLLTDNTNNTFSLTGTLEGIEGHKEIISGTSQDTGILCPKETTKTAILHVDVTITEASGTPIKLSHL